jgi:transposase InsO family protein
VNDKREEERKAIALFRYGIISDLLHTPRDPRGERGIVQRLLDEKAARSYAIPGSRRTRVAVETIRGWVKDYRTGGFDALLPKPRRDVGESRSIPKDVQDLLLMMKDEHPDYSLPVSTVHRLLSRHGLMRKHKEGASTEKDHRHFEFERANQLWMSDVMHGPSVVTDKKRKKKTYLIAFIDDATRVVPFASFALAENTAAFLPVLKQAILRRGIPERLFVDNGSAFRSHQLAIVMAKLGVTLVHARAHHPQAKGKIERFFRTARGRLLTRLTEDDLGSIEMLNRRLWAWVEGEYHQTPHSALDETPLDRWARLADDVRPARADVDEVFLFEAKRKVRKDRIVSLDGRQYEVDANLVDKTVVLRFEPVRSERRCVQVWFEGRHVQTAKPVDAHANCFVRRDRKDSIAMSKLTEDEEVR